jgi:hypothetical protein
MPVTIAVFLESLLKSTDQNIPDPMRINQIGPYFNNPEYEVFIYTSKAQYDSLHPDLRKVGVKKGPLFPSSPFKIVVFPENENNENNENKENENKENEENKDNENKENKENKENENKENEENNKSFLAHKGYLQKKAEKGGKFIVVGASTDKRLVLLHELAFLLVDWPRDWPHGSTKTLSKLLDKQLDAPLLDKQLDACTDEIGKLIEAIRKLNKDIGSLGGTIMELEKQELILVRELFHVGEEMLRAEEGQTHLIKDLLAHHPIALIEIGLTVAVLGLHIIQIFKDKEFRKACALFIERVKKILVCFSSKPANDDTVALLNTGINNSDDPDGVRNYDSFDQSSNGESSGFRVQNI